ncbi:MAG: sulfatase [Variovorax paradoxus]|uniref:Sulfatase n=1 Tax=Variovorax paradoxus TaxID=34073 RepID=A0A2W5QMP8_VARPD|nr:MAG: sulfatase [Variovorax paradoxus]
MKPTNFLLIITDEHQRGVAGCYGNEKAITPNLDALARRGKVFDNAYTPSPICVPARGALAAGDWVNKLGYWDNAIGFHGEVPSWHARIRDAGHDMVGIGKMHFRSMADDNGFSKEILTMHMMNDGAGDLIGSIRNPPPPPRSAMPALAASVGPGECSYNDFDRDVAQEAVAWLQARAAQQRDQPWGLMVSFVRPHYPLTVPQKYYDMFDPAEMSLPDFYAGTAGARHPWVDQLSKTINYGDHFKDSDHVRRAIASYYALVAFVDEQIGAVLDALATAGFTDSTRIVYSTDHGDNIGRRGLWGKSVMYEEAVAIPLITAGPDVEPGTRSSAPVSLVDVYKSALEAMDIAETAHDRALPSMSLWKPEEIPADRSIVSEYHAMGSQSGCYMLRWGRWKYIHYVHHLPELFDVSADPAEVNNLAQDPAHRQVVEEGRARLLAVCDPEATDKRAFEQQQSVLNEHGGADEILRRGDQLFTPPPGKGPTLHFAEKAPA